MEFMKTWPDIMSGKKIMYVHGFASSGQSGTVKLLRQMMPQTEVVAPDLPIHPQEAVCLLNEWAEREHPDLIIGSSMGGMMAEMLKGYDRILVNPAFQMGDTMGSHGMTGKLTFQNPRRDGVQEMVITKAIVKEYKELTEHCFEGITPKEDRHVWALFGDRDPLVHTREIFLDHYTQGISFHGEHRLIDSVVHHSLMPVIRWIDDRQEGRQRETIYIDINAMWNQGSRLQASGSKCMAQPSAHKAFETLLDTYNLYIVAPSPTNSPDTYNDVLQWCKDIISVPAHDHIIFTNTPEMLYGDYYISPDPPKDSMASTIGYGSDTFKTWEEILTFFERLNG